jgi:hypothetical protein
MFDSAFNDHKKRPGSREMTAMLAGLMALNAFAIDAMIPALPDIGRSLNVAEENQRQLVVIAYFIGFASTQLIWGPLADRFGRKPILAAGIVLYGLFALLCAFAGRLALLIAGLVAVGPSAAVTRAEDRDVETARNWTTALKYDRFISERMFLNGNAILTNDRFRDLDLRTALGAGVGYQVLATPRAKLTADAGLGWVNENLESQADDSYTAVRESVSLDAFAVPDRIQFFHVHDGYFGVTGDDNLFVRMQNGIRMTLAAGFVTTLRHDLDYDRSPAIGRSTTDRTLALTLGYRF